MSARATRQAHTHDGRKYGRASRVETAGLPFSSGLLASAFVGGTAGTLEAVGVESGETDGAGIESGLTDCRSGALAVSSDFTA